MVSDGTPEQNRAAVGNGDAEVLLQEDYEVMKAYRVAGDARRRGGLARKAESPARPSRAPRSSR